jgi:hypothetical protein
MKIKNLLVLGAVLVPMASYAQHGRPGHGHGRPGYGHGHGRGHVHGTVSGDGAFLLSLTATTVAWALTISSIEAHERNNNSLVAQDAREYLGTDPVARVATPRLSQRMEEVRGSAQVEIEAYVSQYVRDASDVKRLGTAMAEDLPDEAIASFIVMSAT